MSFELGLRATIARDPQMGEKWGSATIDRIVDETITCVTRAGG